MSTHRVFLPVLAIVAALLQATGLSACGKSQAAAPADPPPPPPMVAVVLPESSTVQATIEASGRIEPSQRVEVRSRVAGYLEAIRFRDGQQVKVGDPLFVIDPRPFAAARERARGALAQAAARARLAAAQYERSDGLMASGATSVEELERARAELEGARAAVTLAQAELDSATLELGFTTVRAPIAGTVADRRIDIGNYIGGGAAQGVPLTTIVAVTPVHAIVDLTEADVRRLHAYGAPPARVELLFDGGGRRQAAVDFVEPELSARSGTLRLRASLPNADRAVLPGSFVRVRIPVGPAAQRLLVPDSAIVSDQNRKMVFVVDDGGRVAPRKVELGALVGERRVVLAGLGPRERVIVAGAAKVRPGDRVRVPPARGGA